MPINTLARLNLYLSGNIWIPCKQSTALVLTIGILMLLTACNDPALDSQSEQTTSINKTAEQYKLSGRSSAEPDFPGLASLCDAPSPQVTPELIRSRAWSMPEGVPPTRVFNQLYFVGNAATSAWVVETSEGLIVVDTLNNAEEAEVFIVQGLLALGLDPGEIKYVVISHAHGDHTGGAKYLVDEFGAKVVMSKVDWDMVSNPATRIDMPGWSDIPEPDITVDTRYILELGDTSIELVLIPGHTLGTMATLIDVMDGDTAHKAVLWGGTGFNFGPDISQYLTYAESAESMRQEVLDRNIEIFLSNHVRRDGTNLKIQALESREAGNPHPFVSSAQNTSKAFEVFRDCALAQATELEEQAIEP